MNTSNVAHFVNIVRLISSLVYLPFFWKLASIILIENDRRVRP